MNYYFSLLGKIIKRHLKGWGLSWFTASLLCIGVFFLLYICTLKYPAYAGYLFMYFGLSVLYLLAGAERVAFLKILFPIKKQFIVVRVLENFCSLVLLLILAVYFSYFLAAAVLLCSIFLFAYLGGVNRSKRSLPTPFRRYPFEFIIHFRRSWYVYLFLFALAAIALIVQNFNLLAVVVAVLGVVGLQAYAEVESVELQWHYSMSPANFLQHKIKRGVLQQSLLLFLPLLVAAFVFPNQILWLLLIGLVANALLILAILMKYAVFPRRIGVVMTFILLMAIVLPFLLIGLIPYYYRVAQRNLALEDYD